MSDPKTSQSASRSQKIKVTHIITMLELGGAQRNTLYTVEHLDRSRFAPRLITGAGGLLDQEARRITDIPISFVSSLGRPIRPWKDIHALWSIYNILKKDRPLIVHTHSSKAGILGRLAARLAGVPIIIHTFHGFGFNDRQKALASFIFRKAEQIMAKWSNGLIFVSEANRRLAREFFIGEPARHYLIRSGISIDRYKNVKEKFIPVQVKTELGFSSDALLATAIGPFKPQKNYRELVEVAQRVCQIIPRVRFVIVGDGEERQEIERSIQNLNLGSQIKILGWRKDIEKILAGTDILVSTALWEGLPRSGVEALVAGVPVFSYAIDGLLDIIRTGENGALVIAGDINSLAVAIALALKDDNRLKHLSEGAMRSIGSDFDIQGMVLRQEELYLKLLS